MIPSSGISWLASQVTSVEILSFQSLWPFLSVPTGLRDSPGWGSEKVSGWKSELHRGWLMMESGALSPDRTAGGSEAVVSEPNVGLQMQKSFLPHPLAHGWTYSGTMAEYILTALYICSLCLIIRHISYSYSKSWMHFPMRTYLDRMEISLLIHSSQETSLEVRCIQFFYSSIDSPGFQSWTSKVFPALS